MSKCGVGTLLAKSMLAWRRWQGSWQETSRANPSPPLVLFDDLKCSVSAPVGFWMVAEASWSPTWMTLLSFTHGTANEPIINGMESLLGSVPL